MAFQFTGRSTERSPPSAERISDLYVGYLDGDDDDDDDSFFGS